MGEEAQFRNAAWGGFNKEDVLRYIEMMKQSALETNMKLDQATRQLQDAQRRVQVLEAQLKQKRRRPPAWRRTARLIRRGCSRHKSKCGAWMPAFPAMMRINLSCKQWKRRSVHLWSARICIPIGSSPKRNRRQSASRSRPPWRSTKPRTISIFSQWMPNPHREGIKACSTRCRPRFRRFPLPYRRRASSCKRTFAAM